MDDLVECHQRACNGFARVAHAVAADAWSVPTPCTEWTAREVVEHVIGFHEFLLLRPLGTRAQRPREGEAARWDATADALFAVLAEAGAVDRVTELPGGGQSSPRRMLGALTTDVLVHTWDLSVATGVPAMLDAQLVDDAYRAAVAGGMDWSAGMVGPQVTVAEDASVVDKLIAFYGRSPSWPA